MRKASPDGRVSTPPESRSAATARLLGGYTALFIVFFAAVYSPFWVYGRSFFWSTDGMTQYLPVLTYSRHWLETIIEGLKAGRLEIPLWSLWVGFGQNTIGTVVEFRPFTFLYALFPYDAIEFYQAFRQFASMYLTGLAFLAFARTRVKDRTGLLLGSMLYLFCGFVPIYTTQHWFFLGMTFTLPLMLLGVDRVFEGKWSWLFVFAVFKEAVGGFYLLYLTTLPAVIYALFHFFELKPKARKRRGGFGRILLRHIVQYAAGLGLAAVGLLPSVMNALASCRMTLQTGVNPLWWNLRTYLNLILGIVDMRAIANNGYIALPGIGLIAVACLAFSRRRRDRLLKRHIALYALVFLIPGLTMLFSAFAGRGMRWCYALSFWVSLTAACVLPRLWSDDGRAFRIGRRAFFAYAVVYLIVLFWTGEGVSISMMVELICVPTFYVAIFSDWGRRRRTAATVLLFTVLLIELTTKSYEWHSPQYGDRISAYANAGDVFERASDNPTNVLEMAADDGVYRTDVILTEGSRKNRQMNYGVRNQINGVSNYYNMSNSRIIDYSSDVANAHQKMRFNIMNLDQRTVLDALAGVRYAALFDDGLSRVPCGYELVGSRERTLLTGETTTEYLYRNKYALPLAYAYEARITKETYDALPPNRREQAMLQGVVLEEETALPEAALTFDDRVILSHDEIMDLLRRKAEEDDYLEVSQDGTLRVKKSNYTVTLPVEKVKGEIYLQFRGLLFESVDFNGEIAEQRIRDGETRYSILNAKRRARQWAPDTSANITATSGTLSDTGNLLGQDNLYYFGETDMLLNLGYGETGKNLKIKFSAIGEYRFDSVTFLRQPMKHYVQKIAPLQANGATSVTVDTNRVTATFDLKNTAFACLAVPYAAGWSATVDGQRARILPANGMYMGVMLTEGAHTVVFTYMQPGFVAGAIISAATLVALIVAAIAMAARRRRRD